MAIKESPLGSMQVHAGSPSVGLHVRGVVRGLVLFALLTPCALAQPVQDAVPEPAAEAGQDPSGEWREQSRAGYRAQPTPHSIAFYRYIMDRTGRGENISTVEAMLIRRMIANRTWPEAPEITARARAIQEWALRQPEEAGLFTDPENWSRAMVSDAVYEQLVAAGLTDADTPHTEASERFRRYWHSLIPEQQADLPLGRWMQSYFVRLGHDMRSDEQRLRDEAFAREQARLHATGLEQQAEAERQRKDAEEAEERQRQEWFEDNWAEEDRRIAREQDELDRIWNEFIVAFVRLDPEQRERELEAMTPEQREEFERRLAGEPANSPVATATQASQSSMDQGAADLVLPVGHHARPPAQISDKSRDPPVPDGAAVVAEAVEALARDASERPAQGVDQGRAVGSGASGATPAALENMRAFGVTVPSIWQGVSDSYGFHFKRDPAAGGGIAEMCPYPAGVFGEVNGRVQPSFGPGSIDEIRQKLEEEAVEHRKWGRDPGIRPFAIGPFQGYLLETRMRYAPGGWSHSGYRDSSTEAIGHGWVTAEGRTFEVSYGVGSGGCWNNSQRPFQESQTLAALREAQGILAGLSLIAAARFDQTPYTGPKLDGSDLPVVRLDPPSLPRLNPGETVIVRAVVDNLAPEDRPLQFSWTGGHEGDGDTVVIRAAEPGSHQLAVNVEGARYGLGTVSLSYEVSNLQVRVERLTPFETGPVPTGSQVSLRAALTDDGQTAGGEFVYRWQPHPEVLFEPQDASTGNVTGVFPEPGRYLVWVQVLRREGEILHTVMQSEQVEIVAEGDAEGPKGGEVVEGQPFAGVSPVPPDSCWHSLNPDPRGWTPMPMAPLHPTTRVTPGNYVVLVGPSGISGKQTPATWRSFGPFRIEAGHTYGATIKDTGDRLIWEQEPLILESFATAARSDPSAYIYVRNDAFLVDYWHAICVLPVASTTDATVDGNWHVEFEYLGAHYPHDMRLTSTDGGTLGGSGGHPAGDPHTFGWEILGGTRQGDNIEFMARYTSGAPGTTMEVRGNIAADGSMSGTWTDNYLGQTRQGTWTGRRTPEPTTFREETITGTPPFVRPAGSEIPGDHLQFGRVLTGATSGRHYFGYTGGQVVLPHREGGTLHFVFWNDQNANPGSTVNRLNIQVGETVVHAVEQYSTALDLKERYQDLPEWGPGGGTVVSVPVPPGVAAVVLDWQGSQTGIGLSDLRFDSTAAAGSAPTVVPYVNRTTEVQPQFARLLTGANSGRQYHGHSGGQVVLPHREGGTLHFVFWNDQHSNPGSTVNRLNVRVGETVVHTVEQYSTALDLKERYQEIPDWGPGGGTVVAIPIPPGVATVVFDSQGSQTGIELSDLRFDSTAVAGSVPTVVPHVNRSTEVQPLFARVLTGANSGRQYHGHSGGQVVLPHREGGVLFFQLWNDQHEQTERTSNQVTVSIGEERRVIPLTTTREQLAERYREFADWGPAGGDRIEVLVPAGIGVVGFDGSGSQAGIEFSGFALHPR